MFAASVSQIMKAKTLISLPLTHYRVPTHEVRLRKSTYLRIGSVISLDDSLCSTKLQSFSIRSHVLYRFRAPCISPGLELGEPEVLNPAILGPFGDEEDEGREIEVDRDVLASQGMWKQIKEIAKFTGPATGLWICGPLMSLIDTAIIGQGSSIELAALGPGTVLCDYMSYAFMFLSIATSNMVATSLAGKDKTEVQHQISIMHFVGLACGLLMVLFTRCFGLSALTAFAGAENVHILPAANTYAQIRGLAWPAVLIGWVAQSASLGMKDSWGPLKALAVASLVNGIGDVFLCSILGYGIAGAAWATMVSQVVAAYMMIDTLKIKGYNPYAISLPSLEDLTMIFGLSAPVFITMMSKIAFFAVIIYFATSMGTVTVAAHQVMMQTFCMCTTWGEPLSQTALSFMPELMYGNKKNLEKARMLLKSLVVIAAILGILLGVVGTVVPWLFPGIFTRDLNVIHEMHRVLMPYFLALVVTPSTLGIEGTLLAGQDLRFISLSMSGCFTFGVILLTLVSRRGFGLPGCWWALVGFQWARLFLSLLRVVSPNSILWEGPIPHVPDRLR